MLAETCSPVVGSFESDMIPQGEFVSGCEIESATPIPNLWNVGDATRAYGDGGLQGCATNGVEVSGRVLSYLAS